MSLGATAMMTTEMEKDRSGLWLTTRWDGAAEVGAHLPLEFRSGDASVSVFWRAPIPRDRLSQIVDKAEHFLAKEKLLSVKGALMAYGATRKPFGPVSGGLAGFLVSESQMSSYDAFRAEFSDPHSKLLVVWANVRETDSVDLDEAGENIGIAINLSVFNQRAKDLIADAIYSTSTKVHVQAIDELMAKVSSEVSRVAA